MLENLGVTHVFGIPGAKIDALFIALLDSKIELVVCRHEQNAAFMAATMGRITGRVGVCIVTSGPGVSNLATGLITATSEGSPVLAIGGEVPLQDRLKQTHQSLDGVNVLKPVTKYAAEVVAANELGDVVGNAVRAAESGRPGAVFISLPKDISLAPFEGDVSPKLGTPLRPGPGAILEVEKAAELINQAKRPAVLLGMQSSDPRYAASVRNFISSSGLSYVSTFQGAGTWASADGEATFGGRVGIFSNQPGDRLLQESDCVITVGYSPIEYDAVLWNTSRTGSLIAIDVIASDQDRCFLPDAEIVGDIAASLDVLGPLLKAQTESAFSEKLKAARKEIDDIAATGEEKSGFPIHPLRVIHELRKVVTDQTTLSLDIGSMYIWMDRYFPVVFPRQFLVSNGQQTLGVALPSAMAANIARPGKPVISLSGDGGFLFSAMELETAKRIGSRFVHLIWDSSSYDMVAFQEEAHYGGRTAGIQLGRINTVAFAEAFGCKGIQITKAEELGPALCEALESPVPVLINIPIDYSENLALMEDVHESAVH